MSEDELRALLAHEVAHVRRGDCLANLVQRICEIPAFFHPGVWLASGRIALAREELADGWALSRGADAGSYARSLAAMAERAQVSLGAVSLGVAEGKSTLLRRVEAIMRGGSLKRVSRPLVVALIGAALVSAGAFAAVQVHEERGAVAADENTADLRALEGEMKNLALAVLMYLQDSKGVFPPTDDIREIRSILKPYLASEEVFEHDLRWVMPAGLRVGTIEDPARTPLVILEVNAKTEIVAYADGHVETQPRAAEGERIIDLTVVNEKGGPMEGARIKGLGLGGEPVLMTDERGYRRFVVTKGAKSVSLYVTSADGREETVVTIPFENEHQKATVTLHPAGETRAATAGTVTFSGRVVDDRGRPVEGASLWVYGLGYYGDVFLSRDIGTTDENGRFSAGIPRLAAGNEGWGGGWLEPWTCQIVAHKRGQAMSWVRTPGNGIVDGGDIRLGKPVSVSGAVRDVNGVLLPQVLVRAETVEKTGEKLQFDSMGDAPPWVETRTDEHGRYTISDLPAGGSIVLEVSLCGAGESYRADEMGPDLGSIDLAKHRGPVDIQLIRQPRIQGRLLTEEGEPAGGVTIRLHGPMKGNPHSIFSGDSVTDEKGRYEFDLTVAGTWTLVVTDKRYARVLTKDLTVDLGDSVDLGTTILGRSATIEGRVLDAASGVPVGGAYVDAHVRGQDQRSTGPAVVTEADGRFTVSALPGEVVLSVGGPKGYTGNQRVTTETVDGQTFVRITSDPDRPSYRIVDGKAGATVTGIALYVMPSATVEGMVLGPDGEAWRYGGYVSVEIDRARVRTNVYPASGGNAGMDGAFSASGLFSGVPFIAALYDEERALGGGARVTPKTGAPTPVTIEMKPLATVVGRVLMPDGGPAAGVDVGFMHVHGRRGSVFATTDADGGFKMNAGMVGTVCSATVVVPSIREREETGAELRLRGFTKMVPVTSSDQLIDLGDIVLERYDPQGRS